jgi:ribosome-binding protein aMBF1 (putative translation factor)
LGRIALLGCRNNVCQERDIWRSLQLTTIVDQRLKTERGGVIVKVDGAKLASARERVFMSQEELAESIGMNPAVVIRLETANRTEIRENLGEDLMQILFVGRSELTSYPDPPEPTLEGPSDIAD